MAREIGAGHFDLKSCLIQNYDRSKTTDISNLITSFTITEGINQVMISCTLNLLDTTNLLDDFPIQGEELVTIEIEDFFGTEQSYEFQVYKISPVQQDYASKKLLYSLSMYSLDFMRTETFEVRKSYTGNIETTVSDIYAEYFTGNKDMDTEQTDGVQTLVIPALTPFESMLFLARKAYTQASPSATFRFFETRDDFKFVTYEELISRVDRNNIPEEKMYTYYDPKTMESTPEESMKNLLSYQVTKRFNLLSEARSGAMINRTLLLDLSKKTIEETEYKHYEERDGQKSVDVTQKPLHSSRFIEDFFTEDNILQSYIVFKDTTKPESYYDEILPRRVSTNYYFNAINVYAQAYGSFKFNVGDVIKIDLPRPSAETGDIEDHETQSGFYIVETIKHRYEMSGRWIVDMNLIKDSLKGTG